MQKEPRMELSKDSYSREKTFIIAELSANHCGSFDTAIKTIDAMADAGADAVKIQTYTPDSLVIDCDNEYFGPIPSGIWKGIKRYDLYKMATTPYEWHAKLKEHAESKGLIFFSTPFDTDGVDFLESLDVPIYKIASFEVNDLPLIRKVARQHKPIIFSVGCAGDDDISKFLEVCYKEDNHEVSMLKCTSNYPSVLKDANLNTIPHLIEKFKIPVGVSDHTMGYIVPMTAVALGATIVEKHFILDRSMNSADAAFSMEPDEFKLMVDNIRAMEQTFGEIKTEITDIQRGKRRALYAVEDIAIGDTFTPKNVRSLRPGAGLSPIHYDELIGRISQRAIKRGEPIIEQDLL